MLAPPSPSIDHTQAQLRNQSRRSEIIIHMHDQCVEITLNFTSTIENILVRCISTSECHLTNHLLIVTSVLYWDESEQVTH